MQAPSRSPHPSHPEVSHDVFQPHEYEDIQELRAITNNHNDGSSPPDEPNMVAQYTFTQCPAYGPVKKPSTPPPPPHMSHDDLRPHMYEDIQELRATNRNDSLPDEPNEFTQCSAYASVKIPSTPPQYEEQCNDGGSPPDEPNMAQYTFTQCPAYATINK